MVLVPLGSGPKMLHLSKETVFLSKAILDIACNGHPNPVQSKGISKRKGILQRYLEGALQHLVWANILCVVRDPKVSIA